MRIQHNIMAMNAYRNLGTNNTALSKNLEKLSSGYRINRAGDDAAGLAISEKMRAQIAGLDQAQKNAQSGINLVKTAEGALTEVHDMLNRMVTLATQSANGTYEGSDRSKIQAEVDALKNEIDRIADNSNFNGTKLLDGSLGDRDVTNGVTVNANGVQKVTISGGGKGAISGLNLAMSTAGVITMSGHPAGIGWAAQEANLSADGSGVITLKATITPGTATADNAKLYDGLTVNVTVGPKTTAGAYAEHAGAAITVGDPKGLQLQIGASANETIMVNVNSMKASDLGINALSVGTVDAANTAINTINAAIEKVSVQRGNLGAIQNRLEHTINNLGVMEENIQDAESNIRDTDIADEMMAYTKNNILIQSAQAMLAQANQVPQGVLQLMQ